MSKPPVIDTEVLPPAEASSRGPAGAGIRPPVHPLAAILLLAVDNLWSLAEWTVVSWVITIPLAFASVFVPTLILHRLALGQPRARALGWAVLLGAVAAMPFSIGGTAVGAALLGWLGIRHLSRAPSADS